ncbi:MAG: hypothetical protein ACI9K5_001502, partial [Gammaproteobacteria bacterium]
SSTSREREVALLRMLAISTISTMKVEDLLIVASGILLAWSTR